MNEKQWQPELVDELEEEQFFEDEVEEEINPETGRPFGHDRYGEIQAYDPAFVRQIMEEQGLSEGTAILIASAEMSGAMETPVGGVRARQTYCDYIDFDEALPDSEGADEGEAATTNAFRQYVRGVLTGQGEQPTDRLAQDENKKGSTEEGRGWQPASFADFLARRYPNVDVEALDPEDLDKITEMWLAFNDPDHEVEKNDFREEAESADDLYFTQPQRTKSQFANLSDAS
jgi:hypothetical protein